MIILITEKFLTRIDKCNKEKDKLTKSINSIATIRLISFLFIIYFVYKYIKTYYSNLYFSLIFLGIIVFISLVIYHNKVKDKLNFAKSLIGINNNYLDRVNGNWINFLDFGEDFMDKAHPYSNDLDIVGGSSLFQRINLSHNFIGRQTLANDLLNPEYNQTEILNRQISIEELGTKLDFIQYLEHESKNTKIKDPEEIISYFEDNQGFSYSKNIKSFINLLPFIVTTISIVIVLFKIQQLYILVFALITVQIILWLLGIKKNEQILNNLGLFKDNLEVYLGLLKVIEQEDFDSPLLKSEKDILFCGEGSIRAIKKLDMVSEKINMKHTGVLYLLLNIFFLWDYRCVNSLENWKMKHGKNVRYWIESIGKIQALCSLSVLLQVEENISFPIVGDEKNIISISCGHPLIQIEERINNNINILDNILVITGSNMSGKTTFLRTIGVNLVLLNAGSVTVSKQFKSPIMNLYTSMRVTDDLKNKISTFYAELLRIKEILDYAKDNHNTLFLIDEIFKGTNSKDRILGAKNVLLNLNKLGMIGAITTHDFELCELDIYPRIKNYHFAEDYLEGKISFDYKIKEGRSTSTNARYLMELVGIEIID